MAIKFDSEQDISQIRSEIHKYQWQFDKTDDELEIYKCQLRKYKEALDELNQPEEIYHG
jgi:peptidoglycan hydrolase CwlO-like protein